VDDRDIGPDEAGLDIDIQAALVVRMNTDEQWPLVSLVAIDRLGSEFVEDGLGFPQVVLPLDLFGAAAGDTACQPKTSRHSPAVPAARSFPTWIEPSTSVRSPRPFAFPSLSCLNSATVSLQSKK